MVRDDFQDKDPGDRDKGGGGYKKPGGLHIHQIGSPRWYASYRPVKGGDLPFGEVMADQHLRVVVASGGVVLQGVDQDTLADGPLFGGGPGDTDIDDDRLVMLLCLTQEPRGGDGRFEFSHSGDHQPYPIIFIIFKRKRKGFAFEAVGVDDGTRFRRQGGDKVDHRSSRGLPLSQI